MNNCSSELSTLFMKMQSINKEITVQYFSWQWMSLVLLCINSLCFGTLVIEEENMAAKVNKCDMSH